jgi:formylglycine-generating enzyme required for sulfatase activity
MKKGVLSVWIAVVFFFAADIAAQPEPAEAPAIYRNEVFIEGGVFTMGSPSGGYDRERPVHRVTLDSFFIMKTEVTVGAFADFIYATGYTADPRGLGRIYVDGRWKAASDANWRNPYFEQNNSHPVVLVNWYDAVAYANWLSEKDGLSPTYGISGTEVTWNRTANGWRLPTEAEWEYAARGGGNDRDTTYAGSDSVDSVAWYRSNSGEKTHPVAGKQPNELGLHDMSGNASEWIWDRDGSYGAAPQHNPQGPGPGTNTARVIRGGNWNDHASQTRVASRYCIMPSYRDSNHGFRLVRPSSPSVSVVFADESWRKIDVVNSDFDAAGVSARAVYGYNVEGWEHFSRDSGIANWGNGDWVGFSNRQKDGGENGLLQRFDETVIPGEYRLSVYSTRVHIPVPGGAPPEELLSRVELGYESEQGRMILGAHEVVPEISLPSRDDSGRRWTLQLVTAYIESTSPAVGKKLYVFLTALVEGVSSRYQEKLTYWDHVSLERR